MMKLIRVRLLKRGIIDMATKNWIAGATANAHGQFAKKAHAAGMSTVTFAKKKKGGKGITAKQAQLAATLMKASKGKMPMNSRPAPQPKGEVESAAEDMMPGEEQD